MSEKRNEALAEIICRNMGSLFTELEKMYEQTLDKILAEIEELK